MHYRIKHIDAGYFCGYSANIEEPVWSSAEELPIKKFDTLDVAVGAMQMLTAKFGDRDYMRVAMVEDNPMRIAELIGKAAHKCTERFMKYLAKKQFAGDENDPHVDIDVTYGDDIELFLDVVVNTFLAESGN